MREYGRLKRTEFCPWLHADLVDENSTGSPKREQRVALPSAAVEREHQLGPERFPQRPLVDEGLELGCHLGVPAQREVGIDPGLQGRQAHLFETSRLRGP